MSFLEYISNDLGNYLQKNMILKIIYSEQLF